jgi:WD40 repeat protein
VGTALGEVFVCHNRSTRLVFREDTLTQITSIAWSSDALIAFGTTSGRVYIGSIDQTVWVPAASGSPVTAVSLSSDGELVVIARDTGLVDVRRVTDGTDVVSWAMKAAARSIAFSHDGYLVSTLASDNVISLHQSTSGRAIIAFDPGHSLISVRFDDGDRLVGFSASGFGVRGLRLHGMKAG